MGRHQTFHRAPGGFNMSNTSGDQMQSGWFNRVGRIVLCLIALAMACGTGVAQSSTDGAIAGTITDPQGLALPGAQVVIHSNTTNAEQTATTDSAGFFRVVHLQPSTYTVSI